MSKVKNLTKQVVLLRLKSGRTLFVDAGTASEEIEDVELKNNANIERLLERGIITLKGAEKEKPAAVKKTTKSNSKNTKGGK
jgi:hypothetical protein